MDKKQLGQFYTKQYTYIFDGINIIHNIDYIEPFTGAGDLIKYLNSNGIDKVEMFDIDPKYEGTIQQDTLKKVPDYVDKYIITNPPYLARNKNKDKSYYDLYDENDLYKCFIKSIKNNAKGGQIIIPLNFWSSIRKSDCNLRREFLKYYNITRLNIFEEQVFDDTSYTVCSFQFIRKDNEDYDEQIIDTYIYPKKENIKIKYNEDNGWIIGGELYKLSTNDKIIVRRLLEGEKSNTNIFLKAIDDGNDKGKIKLEHSDEPYYGESSSRSFATLHITPRISPKKQLLVIDKFNYMLNDYRDKYHSLFLTNYRETKESARKRISFDLVYLIVNNILSTM